MGRTNVGEKCCSIKAGEGWNSVTISSKVGWRDLLVGLRLGLLGINCRLSEGANGVEACAIVISHYSELE
jgi:hypothetical protein